MHEVTVAYNSLAEYEAIPAETRRELRRQYEQQLADFPRDGGLLVALALAYLDLGLYADAAAYFQRALTVQPREPQTLYYLALSLLKGRRPKAQSQQTIELVDGYLSAAYQLDPSLSHVSMLAAIIRLDYYLANATTPPEPAIEHLLDWAVTGNWSAAEMQALARFAALPDDLASQLKLV